jgi:hypothetical protein
MVMSHTPYMNLPIHGLARHFCRSSQTHCTDTHTTHTYVYCTVDKQTTNNKLETTIGYVLSGKRRTNLWSVGFIYGVCDTTIG